ncbi:MAG TPA: L-threonylcarbamoyladenylate synthase [Dissulfurispiraceae bacterium]|nr:L-threonylcarbamoyladenylate synthase [Dissulfurispiraceae bacterium]
MHIIICNSSVSSDAIKLAATKLLDGGIIAYPTETFYGLGVKYDNSAALERLYAIKQRPLAKTLPIIIGWPEQLDILVGDVTEIARVLIRRFWPGPLTLVFSAKAGLSKYITCDNKIAIRVPGASFALDLARSVQFPITATSANISGKPAAANVQMIQEYFNGSLDLIVDSGQAAIDLPSTIVDVSGETALVLREGAIKASRIFSG